MDEIDDLEVEAGVENISRISDAELLEREFSVSDPENLEGVSDNPPPEGEPFVEFDYDMRGRQERVRCVYCKFPNHYLGVVMKYADGQRRLVGRTCAENVHGVKHGKAISDFDALRDRQDNLHRQRRAIGFASAIYEELTALKEHSSIEVYDSHSKQWSGFGQLATKLGLIARNGTSLVTTFRERDVDAEHARKQRLGDRFEEVKAATKASGESWKIYKTVHSDRGLLWDANFYKGGALLSTRIERLSADIMGEVHQLTSGSLSTRAIGKCMVRLQDLRGELASWFQRLEGLPSALSPQSLQQIADFASDGWYADEAERAYEFDEAPKQTVPPYRYDNGILRMKSWPQCQEISYPMNFTLPSRRILEVLAEAIASNGQPRARPLPK
ncbi:MAG TPA: hypothetical protein VIQ29_18795 [Ancylobacter sp.]